MVTIIEALQDGERLNALLDSHFLQLGRLPGLDAITELACRLLNVETCCISAIDATTQIYKNHCGDVITGAGIPVRDSICQHVVARGDGVVIDDTGQHLLTRYNSSLQKNQVCAYLGMPLISAGKTIGTICVVDSAPRGWTAKEAETLRHLAHSVMLEIQLSQMGLSLMDQPGEGPVA